MGVPLSGAHEPAPARVQPPPCRATVGAGVVMQEGTAVMRLVVVASMPLMWSAIGERGRHAPQVTDREDVEMVGSVITTAATGNF
jgi:hypothetical protein